ncbi:MAG: hypothetical protein ACRDJI_07875, partial [Actinomycetota bacterium]
FYSGVDQYLTYVFDREGYRFTDNEPSDPCRPIARKDPRYDGQRIVAEPDPLPGLDDNDEIAFMVRSTGGQAPAGVVLPPGIESASEVVVADPSDPGLVRYAYVMLASEGGPAPAFNATNGFVRYHPDANARSTFVFSESSYEGYGAAPKGPYCLADGTPTGKIGQRRPLDTAWIRTPRYSFRYDGRWLMTELHVSASAKGDWTYGPDLIDRWKARAFQQDPSSETPCCGYEEEDTNWGGSGILMGERTGPVRTIRETWGADSSTNNVRREVFYRDVILFSDALRVHPIPPLDGIYTQWDYNPGRVTRYYNPVVSQGVAIDGKSDEVFGNLDDPCNAQYDDRDEGLTEIYRDAYETARLCDAVEYHQSVDIADPTHGLMVGGLQWEEVAGPYGTLVTRWGLRDVTPGGAAHSLISVPYYRDDSCFDDGTGSNPGPHLNPRRVDDEEFAFHNGEPRTCWDVDSDAAPGPEGDAQYFQGSIGTHGVHILLIAESDNAHTTLPLTEIDTEQRMVVLPPTLANVGETYGRHTEKPLVTTALLEQRAAPDGPAPTTIEIIGDTSGQITDEATLAARLTSEGAPVADEGIVFTLRGEAVGTDITDDAGAASVTITVAPPAGTAEQGASFAGQDAYGASSATTEFEVLLDDATMALTLTKQGGGAVATATLTETDTGAGLGGREVAFFVDGVEVGTASTGDGGIASFSIAKLKKDQVVKATFEGDDSYAPASTEETYTKQ